MICAPAQDFRIHVFACSCGSIIRGQRRDLDSRLKRWLSSSKWCLEALSRPVFTLICMLLDLKAGLEGLFDLALPAFG